MDCCRQQMQRQLPSYDAFSIKDRRCLFRIDTNNLRHRSKKDLRIFSTSTPVYHTTVPSDYILTTQLTTYAQYTNKLPTVLDSTQPSNLVVANTEFTADTTGTIRANVDDGFTAVDAGTLVAGERILISATDSSVEEETQMFTADKPDTTDTSTDANGTYERNYQLTTSAMANESHINTSSVYMSYTIVKAINKYAQPTIAAVGVAGNTMSMCVMFQHSNRRTSFGIYLGLLAVSDTLALCTSMVFWLMRMFHFSPLRDIDCQIRGWLINSLQMNGLFLILTVTFDRVVAVRFPLKATAWCTARHAKLVSAVIFAVAWLVNSPFYVYNRVKNGDICAMGTSGSTVSFVYPWISVTVCLVIPLVLLVSMNAVIVVALRNRLRGRATYDLDRNSHGLESIEMSENSESTSHFSEQIYSKGHKHLPPISSRDRNAIVTLFLISFTFLLFVTPHFVHIATFSINHLRLTPSQHADYTLFFQISRQLYSMNNACNFFLFCLSGTKFRKDLVRLFHCRSNTG